MSVFEKSQQERVKRWMYRNARPLELALWQHHFEDGSLDAVLKALSAYQNEDGGFGHAVEADNWNPNSTPYSTGYVAVLLDEIGFADRTHPIPAGMLRYLENTPDLSERGWPAVIRSNDDAPHAPWWTWSEDITAWGFTPTMKLCGFILRFGQKETPFYQKVEGMVQAAIDTYLQGTLPDGSSYRSVNREGELEGFSYVLRFMEATGTPSLGNSVELKKALQAQASLFIDREPSKWGSYCVRPSTLIDGPDCLFYEGNEEVIHAETIYLMDSRNEEGVWNIIWNWGAYEKQFAIAENWWRGNFAIRHMLLFRNFNLL